MSSQEPEATSAPDWKSRLTATWRSVLSWMSWSQRKAAKAKAAAQERELLLEQIQLLVQQAVQSIPPPPPVPWVEPTQQVLQREFPLLLQQHLPYLIRMQMLEAMGPLAQAMERQDQLREQRTQDLLAQLRVVEGMLVDLLKDQPGPLSQMQQDLGLTASMTRP